MYAGSVAGIITALFVAYILYTDYGFWHERYVSGEEIKENEVYKMQSPKETFFDFISQTKSRLDGIKENSNQFFGNKDSYSSE